MCSFTFELNCFLTSENSRLSDIAFKELKLVSTQAYPVLRDLLCRTQAMWYAEGDRIYLVGDERELRERLSNSGVDTGTARLVTYSEMLDHREIALRAILHSALARLMTQKGFRPSIDRRKQSYYPYFSSKNGVQVTTRISGKSFTALVKEGLQFAFDLSPKGRALLWIDVKVFTLVHFDSNRMEPGEPVYVICPNSNLPYSGKETLTEQGFFEVVPDDAYLCEVLSEGAFLEEPDVSDAAVVSCASFAMQQPTPVISKVGHMRVMVPYEWVYTTVATSTLRELGIYDRWRETAIRPAPRRYQVMKSLIKLIGGDTEPLVIPIPEGQRLIFNLSPISFPEKMRWFS